MKIDAPYGESGLSPAEFECRIEMHTRNSFDFRPALKMKAKSTLLATLAITKPIVL